MDKIKVIDFDSGCGGFSKGLEDSGFFEVVSNPLLNKNNNMCYNNTHINSFSSKDVIKKKDVDLVIYTPQGKKPNLKKISNYIAFLSINDFDNVIFVMKRDAIFSLDISEKVYLDGDNYPTRNFISCHLIELGYQVYQFVLDGAGFGLCHHNYYSIIWATKSGGNIKVKEGFGFFKRPYRFVKHVLRDVDDESDLNWHNVDYSKRNLYHKVLPGEKAFTTPSLSMNSGYVRLPESFLELAFHYDFYRPSSKGPSIHPWFDRPITLREGALLFGLSNDFIWDVNLKKNCVADMIFNSFPPFISKLMAGRIKKRIV